MGIFIGPMVEVNLNGEDPANAKDAVNEMIADCNVPYNAELYLSATGDRQTLMIEYSDRIRNFVVPAEGSAIYMPFGLDIDDERIDANLLDLIDQSYLSLRDTSFETMIVNGRLG